MTTFILTVISRTPLWVWLLLAALLALGLRQTRDQVLPRWRVVFLPLALGAWSLWSASSAFGWHAHTQPFWLLGAALGVALNLALKLPRRVHTQSDGRVAIGGSLAPLVLIVLIFALRYVGSAALAIAPQLGVMPEFAAASCALYGLPSGLLAARAWAALHARG